MDSPEDLVRKLTEIEMQDVMNKIIDEKIEKEKIRKKKIMSLVSNTNYIEWLVNFTKDKEDFSDNDWVYSMEKLDNTNQEMLDDLPLFFEGIYQYAKNNYIYSLSRPFGECYRIKINNIGFEVGYLSGQGTKFYCRKISLNESENAIDFMDIVNNKKQSNVEYINNSLEYISNILTELYSNGAPIEAMVERFNVIIKKLSENEKQKKEKVLKKSL